MKKREIEMRLRILPILSLMFISFGFASQQVDLSNQGAIYTAYNIWKHGQKVYCINFKIGSKIISAGTRVDDVEITDVYTGASQAERAIQFIITDTGKIIAVKFNRRWHPGESRKSYRDKMFTTKNFKELTAELNNKEIKAIKKGVVVRGMSKKAVRISYGYPAEHHTPSIESNKWFYWVNKRRRKTICFGNDGRAIHCLDRNEL